MTMSEARSAAEAAGVQFDKPVLLHPDNVSEGCNVEIVGMKNRYGTYST